MSALMLLAALAWGQVAEDKLLAKLDAEVERLLADDPQAADVRKAAGLLRATNSSDRWTNYSAGIKILRQTRSKAGVPLLLAYMLRHKGLSSCHVIIPQYAETLAILTGTDIPNPYQSTTPIVHVVDRLVAEWWEPQKENISTDIADWSAEQLQILASRLLDREKWQLTGTSTDPESWKAEPTSYAIYTLLGYYVMHHGSDPPEWRLEELHPKMLPLLLAGAGYRPQPKAKPQRDTSRPVYAAVGLLAALRENGELEELDDIAQDVRQTAGTRLTCVMALFRAGEKLPTSVLLELLADEKNLERRLVAIHALRFSGDDRQAGATLVKLLDDENAEIRTAAICALRGPLPLQAVPRLKQIIDTLDPPQAMTFAFGVLGEYKNREANAALASFLAAGLEDSRKGVYLSAALSGLETGTGQRWRQAGAQSKEFYRAKAQEAVDWWKSEGWQVR